MKLVVTTQDGSRLLIDTNEVPDYKNLYLQEDGSEFQEEEVQEEVMEEMGVKPRKTRKSKK